MDATMWHCSADTSSHPTAAQREADSVTTSVVFLGHKQVHIWLTEQLRLEAAELKYSTALSAPVAMEHPEGKDWSDTG